MLQKYNKESMGTSNLGWLESRFHFSFAQYHNPERMHFGVLRVVNDDIIHPRSGFDTHPHHDMEIITYVIRGEITHKDSMGNAETLGAGEVQYMSAGDGIAHSEHNLHKSQDLRLLQIWILPPAKGLPRLYGSHRYAPEAYANNLVNIVSSQDGTAPVKIHQDVAMYASRLDAGKTLKYLIGENRQLYFIQIEGSSGVNEVRLDEGDALEVMDVNSLEIRALTDSHFSFIEMPKG
jgi:redox-sensitive bicupin YhaK (pirin superfamily)